MNSKSIKICYVISENHGRSYWNRIGVAFVNQDGSLNVKLDAVPVNGEMQIRDYVPREQRLASATDTSNVGQRLWDYDYSDDEEEMPF